MVQKVCECKGLKPCVCNKPEIKIEHHALCSYKVSGGLASCDCNYSKKKIKKKRFDCRGFDPNYVTLTSFDSENPKYLNQLEVQIDGDHYKNYAIQPAEFSYKNKLTWHQGEIIKYIVRYKDKNGKADLEKARHLLDMLIEFEYDST